MEVGNIFTKHITETNRVAIIYDQVSLSYSDLKLRVMHLIGAWKHEGIVAGDKVIVELPNSIEYIICYLAALYSGIILVPIDPTLSKREKEKIYAQIDEKKRVIDLDEMRGDQYAEKLTFDPKRRFAIFFTSGTTGSPKGVCHFSGAMVENADAFNRCAKIDQTVRMFHVMPMSYMAGFLNTVLSPLLAGGSVLIAPQFAANSALNFWEKAQAYNANCSWLSPTMLHLLIRLNRTNRTRDWVEKNFTNIFVGTAPLPLRVKDEFEETFGVVCRQSYGMSEVQLVSVMPQKQLPSKEGSVGPLLEGIEIESRDQGELWIRSSYAFEGYLGESRSESWFCTGDIGRVDREGYLYITGRKKDLIIRGGVNISPLSIEEVILEHRDIQEVAVIGAPHPFWGEEIIAFIVVKEGKRVTVDELKKHCRKRLNPDSIPTQYRYSSVLPRSSRGKIQKQLLAL